MRGTRTERGYGPEHQAQRDAWQQVMDGGQVVDCWRCHQPVDPQLWQLGHDDEDRSITRGPEHPLCNLRAAGRKVSKGVGGTPSDPQRAHRW